MREDRGDYTDPTDFSWDPPPPPPPVMPTGPITDPNDPRLSNPAYASDPDVLNFINGAYGPNGTALNPPANNGGWDPNAMAWNPGPTAGGVGGVTGGGGGSVAPPAPGGGSLIAPFTQPYTPAGSAAPGGGQPIGSPSDYLTTIPGAPQFPNIPRFQAPTMEEAMADPGYAFTLKQGDANLQNWAAAKGTLNDSSTAKALIDYGQGAATTQYGNVWDRAAQTYDRNTTTQYLDPFAAAYQTWMGGTVNPTMSNFSTQASNIAHTNDVAQQDNWNSWLQKWNIFRDQRDSTFNKQTAIATA